MSIASPTWRNGIVIAVAVAISAALRNESLAQDEAHEGHREFMVPREILPHAIPISDPRLGVKEVRCSSSGGRIVIEDDIDLGSVGDIVQFAEARTSLMTPALIGGSGREVGNAVELPGELMRWQKMLGERNKFLDVAARLQVAENVLDQMKLVVVRENEGPSEISAAFEAEGSRLLAVLREARDKGAWDITDAKFEHLGAVTAQSAVNISGIWDLFRWPDGIIPYEIDKNVDRNMVQQAMNHWHSRTDKIRFVERTQANKSEYLTWVHVVKSKIDKCSSMIGKRPTSGEQPLELGQSCKLQQVIHELGHTIGLWHEQSRNDRDSYLLMRTENASPKAISEFDKHGREGIDVPPFDFDSIMLYPPFAFTKDPDKALPTMLKRGDPTDFSWGLDCGVVFIDKKAVRNGRTTRVSDGDLAGIDFMYKDRCPLAK